MFIELIKNVALILALCYLQGVNVRLWHRQATIGKTVSGVLFGSVCLIGMLTPLVLQPGVIFDARSVVLSMAGLFGGALVACIATAMAVATRLWIGGTGVETSLLVIMLCPIMGLIYRAVRSRKILSVKPLTLAMFGAMLHLAILAIFQLLPAEVVNHVNERVALPFLLVSTLATVALGLLLRDIEVRQVNEMIMKGTAARLRAIAEAIPDALLLIDEDGRYVEVISSNDASLFRSASKLIGKRMHDVLPAALADRFMEINRETLRSGEMQDIEYELKTRLGLRHYEGRTFPLGTQFNEKSAVVFLARDITQRKLAEGALRESELRFRTVLRNIPSVSVQGYLADGTTTYWNKASEVLYGYTSDEAMGSNLLELIIPPPMRDLVRHDVQKMFETGIVIPAGELQLQRKDGSMVDVFSSHAFIEVPGQPSEMFCIDIDISGRKAAEKEARYLACYDVLTELPNRRLLVDRLEQVLSHGARSGSTTAVLFVDLDNFKTLNDTRGHEVGDMLLKVVASRLRTAVREQDTVARLGGDEFVVVVPGLSSDLQEAACHARALGSTILEKVRQPCHLNFREHHASASIGIALLNRQQESVDEVLKQADMAMYHAKGTGRNTLLFFDPEMQQALNRRAMLESELHLGLRGEQFLLLYQPQVDASGHIIGAEALVRWLHPVHKMVPPSEFIPLAEESGLILPLGDWILNAALEQQASWQANPKLSQLSISINVSARQFIQEDFVAQVLSALQNTGANPQKIKLELTESLLLHSIDKAIVTMQSLRAYGIQFSLDDFGTGYSSLNYLKLLPLSQIKIDQGFVRGVLQDCKDAAIARAIIELANNLGLEVIAEGVETAEHYRFLMEHGCQKFQGYFFGKPMPKHEIENIIKEAS